MTVLDRFRVVLLDLNGTFMFGQDRFGPGEDFAASYRSVGGRALEPRQVEWAVRACYDRLAADYENPERYDDFPRVGDMLRAVAPDLPDEERERLERVFALHELGRVPPVHAAFLHRLAGTHALGLVANVWSEKGLWVQELERAGVLGLFRSVVFSSDTTSIKPSPVLFERALRPFGVPRSEAVFVGDSLRCDLQGAKGAGLATVWINPAGTGDPAADWVVGSLLDLDLLLPASGPSTAVVGCHRRCPPAGPGSPAGLPRA
jgi:FMN phosphatase YigB (HAD superfamily)